ncbi:MAG: hypothetical protein F4117_13315 [Acidimicrobiales bacterium]|nr:hypothetical protein [Acidimicrobiales bacterium]MYD06217.1 hypothetical protein [Acidimicrobiaceae bacterium]MXX42704.1 hypothetical protein [Acidimicrobiales bacterium]MYB81968.1 hypothetical protein [Acidimicrobiales bacterium]MYI09719.1 hypothetical protein [Acidimicrobiales bacterium]
MTPTRRDLKRQARGFAAEIQGLLNKTVTIGISLSPEFSGEGNAILRYRAPDGGQSGGDLIPLTISRSPAKFGIRVFHALTLDEEDQFLQNTKSVYALATIDGDPILTYDFVRDVGNGYPEAHLHIDGESVGLQRLLDLSGQPQRSAPRLHLPVGGRRFRPCLEDLIEFCITERLVRSHDGWAQVIREARQRFHLRQLSAAVRRAPEVSAEALRSSGWTCTPPA